jgi:hypothetical protein
MKEIGLTFEVYNIYNELRESLIISNVNLSNGSWNFYKDSLDTNNYILNKNFKILFYYFYL